MRFNHSFYNICAGRVTFQHFKVLMSKTENFFEENKLIRSLANDEQAAFQKVYKSCSSMVIRSLQNMSASISEAEGIFHASILVLYEKAKQADFILECKISTFLVAVARKKWLKQLEAEKRLNQKEQDYARIHYNEKANDLFDMQNIYAHEEQLDKLHRALNQLGSPCNELLRAFYIEEKSMKELAIKFDYTSADNAKTQKHKCLKRLKKIYLKKE